MRIKKSSCLNVVVAPDSFKGSLTSIQASEIMKKAIIEIIPSSKVTLKPMADGGEGTLQSLNTSSISESIAITCSGPRGEKVNTTYAIIDSTAIMECANVIGLTHVPSGKRNPDFTTSYGLGEMMIDALDRGCTSFIIGLGGSATNDGGLGMLQAMGMQAWDKHGDEVGLFGKDIHQIDSVGFDEIDMRLSQTTIKVACDVNNLLCGERGATAVYGPQKGATAAQITQYDASLALYADLIEAKMNQSLRDIPGAGAAGGLGFALLALGANLVSGAALLADTINVEEVIKWADLVITGEGQSDEQTLFGKAPGYIATLANKYNVPVVLISGSLAGDLDRLRERFSGCFSIINRPMTIEACMEQAEELLYDQTKQIIHLLAKEE